ncbi:MAG: 30S ribosomal protein S2 [Planctomycetota bacterium]|nr:30S ribosomal protein S2 [Planctomycetota bacterium]
MAIVSLEELVKAGVHFGHKKSRWNPRMKPYIHSKKNNMHLIDLRTTIRGLVRATNFLEKLVHNGGEVLLVGTKHQIKNLIKSEANRIDAHYVCERWLGGCLTNYATIRARLKRLVEIEEMERSGLLEKLSKKMLSQIARERRKLLRNLEGVRHMSKLPDALIIVDPRKEHIAVAEAFKLKIPTICIIDTDSDPLNIDIVVPGNDDSFRSVQILLTTLVDAAQRGKIKRDTSLVGLPQKLGQVAPAPAPEQTEAPAEAAPEVAAAPAAETPAEAAPAAAEAPAEAAPAAEAPAPAAADAASSESTETQSSEASA